MSYLNDYSRTIRIPSNLVQLNLKNKKEEILNEYQNEINDMLPYCISFYNDNNDELNLIDFILDDNYTLISEPDITLKNKINKILNVLDDREKTIIKKYYGFNDIESNLEALGEEFSCTKERIRQIKDKALLKLRNESYELIRN
jgi:DNA-directed RNA polymerase sigma subunit (sigma70/sigma32)